MKAPASLRELLLAALCCELKSTVIDQQTKLDAAHAQQRADAARIALLRQRNQQLIAAVHRTACAG